MSQKSSDRETIPLCSAHHKEQHRIGLREFCRTYELDLPALIRQLTEKPRIVTEYLPWNCTLGSGEDWEPPTAYYFADYRQERFKLLPVDLGLTESIELAKVRCREYLIEQMFTPIAR